MAAGSLKGKGMNESRYAAGRRDIGKDFFKSGPGDAAAPKMNMDNAKAMRFAKGGSVRKYSKGGDVEADKQYVRDAIDREQGVSNKIAPLPKGKKPMSAFGRAYDEARRAGKKDFEFKKADGTTARYTTESAEEKRARKYADKTTAAPGVSAKRAESLPTARRSAQDETASPDDGPYLAPSKTPHYDALRKDYEDKLDANYGNSSKEVSDAYNKAKETWDYNQAGYKKGGAVKPMKKAMGGAAKVRKGVI